MSNDVWNYLLKYLDMFGEGFPTYELARGKTDAEIITMIKKCLKEKKTAYDLHMADEYTDEEI